MGGRSLFPWLVLGALLASAYGNIVMYRGQQAPVNAQAPASSSNEGLIPAFHLIPGSSDDRCPTLDQLELTTEQRDKIRQCSLMSLDVRTDLAIEIASATAELQGLLSNESIDNAHALELADHVSVLRSQQYKAWIGSILVVRDVLTPEQLQLIHTLESE